VISAFGNYVCSSTFILKILCLHRDLLDGLRKRGFKVNDGPMGSGLRLLVWTGTGGACLGIFLYLSSSFCVAYTFALLDTGGSQLIVDGKIKIKSGPQIKTFTERGIEFDDGSMLEADVIVFATGYDKCSCFHLIVLYLTVH
jgi:Flavin-binding monooxygenase-like